MAVSEADAEQILGATFKSRTKAKVRPKILIDNRENKYLRFPPEMGVDAQACTLTAGDYSVAGFSALIALERKSNSDLISTLSQGRDRFEAELELLTQYRWAAILVEGRQEDIEAGAYRSAMTPKSVIGSLRAIWMRFGVPTFYCGDARGCAEQVAWYAHRLWLKHADLADFGEKESA